jgi:hypothetical protein
MGEAEEPATARPSLVFVAQSDCAFGNAVRSHEGTIQENESASNYFEIFIDDNLTI